MPQLRLEDQRFQCWMKENGLDCTFTDQCGQEVGRHGHDFHHLPKDETRWCKIFGKVGIVDEQTGADLRKKWGDRTENGVKYEQNVFVPAPSTDGDDSWLYKLYIVKAKKNEWTEVKKSTVEGWKVQAVMSQKDIDAAAAVKEAAKAAKEAAKAR